MRRIGVVGAVGVAVLALVALQASGGASFVGAARCKVCHKLQFDSWAATPHAKATDTARGSSRWPFGPECLRCHATNRDEALPGVQCEACHGPGSNYQSMQIMKDRQKALAAGLVIPTQATCDGCHDGKDHHTRVMLDRSTVHAHKK